MNRKAVVVIVAVVAVLIGAVALALTVGREESGTDDHVHIEPITTADEVAVAVMAGLLTWTPATQQSPWDAMHAISDQLTGQLAQAAQTRPDPDPTPKQWPAWARSGDRVIGATDLVSGQDPVADDAVTAERLVTVRQKVLHPDGFTTPLEEITIAVQLERVGQDWKVANFRYRSIGPGQ
jgi:hypothetical protein